MVTHSQVLVDAFGRATVTEPIELVKTDGETVIRGKGAVDGPPWHWPKRYARPRGSSVEGMRFGFHFLDFTIPGSPASIAPMLRETAVAAEEVGASWFTVMDHWFQMEAYRTAYDADARGLHDARLPRRASPNRVQARHDRHRRDLPASRPARRRR